MKNKIDELKEALSDSRKKISCLEERIVKEESDKLVCYLCCGMSQENLHYFPMTSFFVASNPGSD